MTLFLINGVPCVEVENGYRAISQSQVYEMAEHNEIENVEVIEHD